MSVSARARGQVLCREEQPAGPCGPLSSRSFARARRVIAAERLGARHEADSLLERARREADRLVADARRDCERLRVDARTRLQRLADEEASRRAEARREALEEGYREGLSQWQQRVLKMGEESRQALDHLRPQLLALAVKTATHLLRQELEQRPEAVSSVVEGALETVSAKVPGAVGRFELHVHPEDLVSLQGLRYSAEARDHRWRKVELFADESMERGGCRIETEFGTVDCSVEAQSRVLMDLLGEER